jgi:hypothetical protein
MKETSPFPLNADAEMIHKHFRVDNKVFFSESFCVQIFEIAHAWQKYLRWNALAAVEKQQQQYKNLRLHA